MSEALLLARRARALAGEAASDEADWLAAVAGASNIVKDSGSGPTLGENAAAPRVPFAEPSVFDAGEVEPVVEEADSGEY